jgi:hypothetical protein
MSSVEEGLGQLLLGSMAHILSELRDLRENLREGQQNLIEGQQKLTDLVSDLRDQVGQVQAQATTQGHSLTALKKRWNQQTTFLAPWWSEV